MGDAALERKFRELVAHGAPHCDAARLLEALSGLAQAEDAAGLLGLTVRCLTLPADVLNHTR